MDAVGQDRPRRRRPPTRGLLFGAPLDRLPSTGAAGTGGTAAPRPDPVPIALIGESSPVAPPRVEAYGAMAAAWPLVDRPRPARGDRTGPTAAPAGARATGPVAGFDGRGPFGSSVVLPDRREHASGPVDGVERRGGGLSAQEWHRLLGR